MPRVDYSTSRRGHVLRSHGWRYAMAVVSLVVLVVAILVGGTPVLKPGVAKADQLPDPNAVTPGDPVSLVISENSSGLVVNAPTTWAKLYFDPSDPGAAANIRIWNLAFNPCNSNNVDPDWVGPNGLTGCSGAPRTAPEWRAMYDFYAVSDTNETLGPLLFTLNGQTGLDQNGVRRATPVRNGWSTLSVPFGSLVSSITGFKVVYVKAYFLPNTIPAGYNTKLHSFRIDVPGANDAVGYWAQAGTSSGGVMPTIGQYAVHYVGPKIDYRVPNIGFYFAPPCGMNSPTVASLRWFDADAGINSPTSFDFYQIVPGNPNPQLVVHIDARTSPSLGGNNIFSEYVFTAQPGYKYQWVWHNIHSVFSGGGAANNIQFWVPFDSVNYESNCFRYTSTINAAPGTVAGGPNPANPVTLDFSNPANYTNMTWQVNIKNELGGTGPDVFVRPTITVVSGSVTCNGGFSDTWGPPLINKIHGPLGPNQTVNNAGQFSCSLGAATQDKSVFCIGDHIWPHLRPGDPGVNNDPPDQCYIIQNERRYPSVVGHHGDVHAGGGLCNQASVPPPYFVQGNSNATGANADYGDFVVSSAGLAANFDSNGAGGGTALRLGANGNYDTICRVDLYNYASTHPTGTTVAGGTWNLGAPEFAGNVVFISGNASLTGSISHQLTVVASGDVTINHDIFVTSGNVPRNAVPSLGIIAHGNINISSAAANVDAFVFSDGRIDTCVEADTTCANTLTVNGFLMADTLSLRRLGPFGSTSTSGGPTTGEVVNLNPALYLNPPTYFDSQVDNAGLQELGERQPLF